MEIQEYQIAAGLKAVTIIWWYRPPGRSNGVTINDRYISTSPRDSNGSNEEFSCLLQRLLWSLGSSRSILHYSYATLCIVGRYLAYIGHQGLCYSQVSPP